MLRGPALVPNRFATLSRKELSSKSAILSVWHGRNACPTIDAPGIIPFVALRTLGWLNNRE